MGSMEQHGMYQPQAEDRMSPGQQPPSPLVKGSQRVVTLAQHISEVITKDYTRQSQQQSYHSSPVLDLTRPPSVPQPMSASQDPGTGPRYAADGPNVDRNRDRSPPQPKTSPVSMSNIGIEPVSPAGASSDPETLGGASYPSDQGEPGMVSRSPPNPTQHPAFFSKLTESTSAIVKSKKQEMIKKMTVVGTDGDFNAGQPGTEIFNMPASTTAAGPVSVRSHAPQETSGNSIGLEAIIRKALMGNYDDQAEERPPSNPLAPGGPPSMAEDAYAQQGGGKPSKSSGRSNGRKAKSPGPGQQPPPTERPSSVSSVHSEGDCSRLTTRVWDDRPSSTGPTPFPCNPLTMRFPSGIVSAASPSPGQQGAPGGQGRPWEEEAKPLLCSQYETLSDSE